MNRQFLKILLIEDNPAWAELITTLLKQSLEQYEIQQTERISDAIRSILTIRYDIVLLDLSLPDSSGLEGVHQIRAVKTNLPIIVLTVLDDRNVAIDSVRQGAQDYLIKAQLKADLLSRSILYAIERQRAAERERLIRVILENFRIFPDLFASLQASVLQIKEFFLAQQVLIYRNNPSAIEVVATTDLDLRSSVNHNLLFQLYLRLIKASESSILIVKNLNQINLIEIESASLDLKGFCFTKAEVELLEQLQIESFLIIIIEQMSSTGLIEAVTTSETSKNSIDQPWGMLVVYNYDLVRPLQPAERDFLQHLSDQLTINVIQSETYSRLQLANQKLEELAMLDGLTELANRRHFDRVLHFEWQRLAREQKPLSLILCDIDCFKLYNDTYGHPAGDICIQQIAQVLQKVVKRPADLVARYGGEEFAIILPDTSNRGASWIASKIARQIEALEIPHASSCVSNFVTLSLGVNTQIPTSDQDPRQLLETADRALYKAKQQGRNQIVVI